MFFYFDDLYMLPDYSFVNSSKLKVTMMTSWYGAAFSTIGSVLGWVEGGGEGVGGWGWVGGGGVGFGGDRGRAYGEGIDRCSVVSTFIKINQASLSFQI